MLIDARNNSDATGRENLEQFVAQKQIMNIPDDLETANILEENSKTK